PRGVRVTAMDAPAERSRDRILATGSTDGDAALRRIEKLRQELRPGEVGEAELLRLDHVRNRRLDGRRGDQGHPFLQTRSVLGEKLNSKRAQVIELVPRAARGE